MTDKPRVAAFGDSRTEFSGGWTAEEQIAYFNGQMHGEVICQSVHDDTVKAVILVRRRWWQFWKRKGEQQLVTLTVTVRDKARGEA